MMSSGTNRDLHIYSCFLATLIVLVCLASPAKASGKAAEDAADGVGQPAFTPIPELNAGFVQLYTQKYRQARETFSEWESKHPQEPFGEVAIAASYLYEEFYRQGV